MRTTGPAKRRPHRGTIGGEPYYRHGIGLVRGAFDGLLRQTRVQAADVERAAASAWPTDRARAVAGLTAFSGERATADYDLAVSLEQRLP
jgi:hypothetical protein